jgi:hypothetical protein
MLMIDYGKIARDERAKQDAASNAAAQKQRREEASIAFFKNIEASLAIELKKANPELHKYDLLVGHKAGGISMDPKRFETQVRLSYGRASSCEVNLDQANATIQVEMHGEPDASGIAVPQSMLFQVTHNQAGSAAQRLGPDQQVSGQFGPEDIAELVVAGLIRSQFE